MAICCNSRIGTGATAPAFIGSAVIVFGTNGHAPKLLTGFLVEAERLVGVLVFFLDRTTRQVDLAAHD